MFKATQRYDGKPARGEGFVLLNYNNTAPTTSVAFGVDHANTNIGTLIVTTSAGDSGKTTVAVAGNAGSSKLMYKVGGQSVTVPNGMEPDKSWADLPSNKTVEAATGAIITVIELGLRWQGHKGRHCDRHCRRLTEKGGGPSDAYGKPEDPFGRPISACCIPRPEQEVQLDHYLSMAHAAISREGVRP